MFQLGPVNLQRRDHIGFETGPCTQRLSRGMGRLDRVAEACGAHTGCECADAASRLS